MEEYGSRGDALTRLGYNGGILNLKPSEVVEHPLPPNEEAQVDHIIKNNLMTSNGGLYWAGVIIANCDVFVAASKQASKVEEERKATMARKKKEKQDQVNDDGRTAFLAWTESGRRADEKGYPVLNKKDAYAILRILLP